MVLEVVDSVLAEPDFCAADQAPHQVLGLVAHLHVRRKVEAVLENNVIIFNDLKIFLL
jgi:hypothetical protein